MPITAQQLSFLNKNSNNHYFGVVKAITGQNSINVVTQEGVKTVFAGNAYNYKIGDVVRVQNDTVIAKTDVEETLPVYYV